MTYRNWFQLPLKESFTVFRDSEFPADMNPCTVKRVEDAVLLRTNQFTENARPIAHPVRPDSFIEISNFYILIAYEKGSEAVRMIHTLLGAEGLRKGSDLYFQRHDGQAVACDDFVKTMEDANGIDLTQSKRWYNQSGTLRLAAEGEYEAVARRYTLMVRQSYPSTPGQPSKEPFVILLELGLLDGQGYELLLRLEGEAVVQGDSRVLTVTEAEQHFAFVEMPEQPLPLLLCGFSAPVKLSFSYSRDQLLFLMQHDNDGFNRWEAGQQFSVQALQELIGQHQRGAQLVLDPRLIEAYRTLLADEALDQAMAAEMFSLPSEVYLTETSEVTDVDTIHATHEFARQRIGEALFEPLWQRYQASRKISRDTAYLAKALHTVRRSLQNIALSYLSLSGREEILAICLEQHEGCDNMTERPTALVVLVNSGFETEKGKTLAMFADYFKDDPLVMDQWFSVQVGSPLPGGLERVQALMQHPTFTLENSNKARTLIGAFANQNLVNFHRLDGASYRFLADRVTVLNALNSQIASRLLVPLTRWRKYDEVRQALMRGEPERILAPGELSSDIYEVASESLA